MQTMLEHRGAPEDADKLIKRLRGWLADMPNRGPVRRDGLHIWSPHALVRAAKHVFSEPLQKWQVVDGFFIRRQHEHAWLACKDGLSSYCLDLRPLMAMGGPIIVSVNAQASPWIESYIGDMPRFQSRLPEFVSDADEIERLTRDMSAA